MASTPNIAPTSFGTKPNDSAVTVDIYNNPPATPVNNWQGLVNSDTLNKLQGSNNLGASIFKSITTAYTAGNMATSSSALSSVASSLGIQKGALSNLSSGMLSTMLQQGGFYGTGVGKVVDGLAKVTTGNPLSTKNISSFKDFSVVVDGAKSYIKNLSDVSSLQGLSNVIGSITGDNALIKALNLTQIASTIVGLNNLAKAFNIPKVFDRLMTSLTSGSDTKLVAALVATGTTDYGDLSYIRSLLTHLTGAELLTNRPTIIKDIVSSFGMSTAYPSASATAGNDLIAVLNSIDPNWNQYVDDSNTGTYIENLDIFKSFSNFSKTACMNAGIYTTELTICGSYTAQPFVTLTKQCYPFVAISTATK